MSEWMGEWMGEWSGYPLDCYDYQSTYGAKKETTKGSSAFGSLDSL